METFYGPCCDRYQKLTDSKAHEYLREFLVEIYMNDYNWQAIHYCKACCSHWLAEHEHPERQGGGDLILTKIEPGVLHSGIDPKTIKNIVRMLGLSD